MAESTLNAIQINEATGDIVIACGGTGYFKAEIETDGEFNTETDVGVFAVGKKSRTRREQTYTTVLRRHYPLVPEGDGRYSVLVEIANEDTRDIPAGSYVWTLILVTDPEYDENEQVIVGDRQDGVFPLYQGDEQPKFDLKGVAYDVDDSETAL